MATRHFASVAFASRVNASRRNDLWSISDPACVPP